jgi:hypothetical protein
MDLVFGGEMRPVLLAIAATALMASCANNSGGGAPGTDPEQGPTAPDVFREITPPDQNEGSDVIVKKPIDITNKAICQGPTPEMTWLFSSEWSMKHKLSNGVELERVMSFTQTDVEVTVKAKYKKQTQQIKVSSALSWNDTDFNLLSQDQDQAVMPLENEDFNLNFSLSPSTVKYSFVGPCLQIELDNSEKLTFVPVDENF